MRYRFELDPAGRESPGWVTLLAVVLAFALVAVFIAATGKNVGAVYAKMFVGAFGTEFGFTETLVKAIPLMLCGLGVSLAYRIQVWNIGAEGQFVAGAMAATAITVYLPGLPAWSALPLMVLAGIAAGALWGLFTALPKVLWNVNELIISLMLNYVALQALDFVVYGPWRDPAGMNFPGTPAFTPAETLPAFGTSRLHLGLLLGLVAVVLAWVFVQKTRWGYELRLLGANPEAARHAGVNFKSYAVLVMLLSGGLAGLAGMAEVSGVAHRLLYGISPGYGYTAIIVAWIARLNPFGIVLSSVLFGGLIVGGYSVQTMGLPSSVSNLLQGSVLFLLIAGSIVGKVRLRRVETGAS
ncbi:MAG: ABC transporter permease [Spirochaetales bacterium]